MNSGHDHHQVTTPSRVNWSVNSWKEFVRLTMVNQESVFRYQLKELHRIYRKQVELTEEIRIGQSQGKLKYTRKRSKKPKLNVEEKTVNFSEITGFQVQVGGDTHAPATPETTNWATARGKLALLEDKHARSAADSLVAMSSSLLRASSDRLIWFAKIVTSVKCNADLASGQQQTRLACKPGQHGNARTQEMQMAGQHGKCQMTKKRKATRMGPCVSSWGMIKNGQRSKRFRASNPLYTFQRGAFLCRWR